MRIITRFCLWSLAALSSLGADIVTKAAPHALVENNYSHTPVLVFALVGVFLCILGLWHSNLLAVGAGLMFGGLCGNAGQLLLYGYASDWIPVGGWLTNLADVSGGVGLLCCFVGYARGAMQQHPRTNERQEV